MRLQRNTIASLKTFATYTYFTVSPIKEPIKNQSPDTSKFIVIPRATKITRTIRILTLPNLHLFQPFIRIDFENGHQHIILEPTCHLYTATKKKNFFKTFAAQDI